MDPVGHAKTEAPRHARPHHCPVPAACRGRRRDGINLPILRPGTLRRLFGGGYLAARPSRQHQCPRKDDRRHHRALGMGAGCFQNPVPARVAFGRHAGAARAVARGTDAQTPLHAQRRYAEAPASCGNDGGKRSPRQTGLKDQLSPVLSAAIKADCGISTLPMARMRFLPSFCFSRSLRLRVASPP